MSQSLLFAWIAGLNLALAAAAWAQEPTTKPQSWPIVLGPDDKSVFPEPPAGFDHARPGIPRGTLTMIEYPSKTVGTTRKALVYTPPGYAENQTYPTLYLLHGIGGDETEWRRYCSPADILDNLYADGKLAPMIVVFPNGRAQKDDHPPGDWMKYIPAFTTFTDDLLQDLMPYVESHYAVRKGASSRALAGFSMGGGQSLNIGLTHPNLFAYVGGFSTAPNSKPPEQLYPPTTAASPFKLIYLACGNQDNLMHVSQVIHGYLKQHDVPHVWTVNTGKHDGETWKKDLYQFAPLLFR